MKIRNFNISYIYYTKKDNGYRWYNTQYFDNQPFKDEIIKGFEKVKHELYHHNYILILKRKKNFCLAKIFFTGEYDNFNRMIYKIEVMICQCAFGIAFCSQIRNILNNEVNKNDHESVVHLEKMLNEIRNSNMLFKEVLDNLYTKSILNNDIYIKYTCVDRKEDNKIL